MDPTGNGSREEDGLEAFTSDIMGILLAIYFLNDLLDII